MVSSSISSSPCSNDIVTDLSPVIKVYRDGTVERICSSPIVPPSPEDPDTVVSSKDIKISSQISARVYLPLKSPKINGDEEQEEEEEEKLPILVYYHGGGFCVESAFNLINHRFLNHLVSHAQIIALSVEYRLAPENPLPAAFNDSWIALQWVASHRISNSENGKCQMEAEDPSDKSNFLKSEDPWLIKYGDFNKIYIGGDSAGGTIAHYLAMRAGVEALPGKVKLTGGFLSHPFFWGSKSEHRLIMTKKTQKISSVIAAGSSDSCSGLYRMWMMAYPSAPGGIDNPLINPVAEDAASLSDMGCSRLLVIVSEKDELRENGVLYAAALKNSGWKGEMELVDIEGEDHCFHVFNPDFDKPKNLIRRIASFIKQ